MKSVLKKKLLIFSVLFFMLSVFIFLFLIKNINDNKESYKTESEKLRIEVLQEENTKALIKLVETISSERNLLETHFVKSSDIVPFLDTIENLAKEVGIKAEVSSVNTEKDNSSLSVNMETSGSFEAIYKLITLLENSQYSLEFISLNIKNLNEGDLSLDKENKVPQWSANFRIKLLSFVK